MAAKKKMAFVLSPLLHDISQEDLNKCEEAGYLPVLRWKTLKSEKLYRTREVLAKVKQ